jgi:hypothetical protein
MVERADALMKQALAKESMKKNFLLPRRRST